MYVPNLMTTWGHFELYVGRIRVKLVMFQKREILAKGVDFAVNNSATFILSSRIQIVAGNFNMLTYSLLLMAYNSSYDAYTFYHCTWWILC